MALYVYKPGEHPSGFIGVRVVVQSDLKVNQKWFSFRDRKTRKLLSKGRQLALIDEAKKLEGKWKAVQYKKPNVNGTKKRSISTETNIVGLTVCRNEVYRKKSGTFSQTYNLVVAVKIDGVRKSMTRSILQGYDQYEKAFLECTRHLARLRGYKRVPSSWNHFKWTKHKYTRTYNSI